MEMLERRSFFTGVKARDPRTSGGLEEKREVVSFVVRKTGRRGGEMGWDGRLEVQRLVKVLAQQGGVTYQRGW